MQDTSLNTDADVPSLVGDVGIHFCFCPQCSCPYAVTEEHLGKLLWCVCGKLLKIAIGRGQDARPPEPAIIEAAETLLECFKCHRWVSGRDLAPTNVASEAWVSGQPIGTEEQIRVTVSVCWQCLKEGDCWL